MRISRNYPAIPKIGEAAGDFDYITQDAVIAFQEIFGLPATGIVNEATWYRISYIFTSVKNLAELNSEGLTQQDCCASGTVPHWESPSQVTVVPLQNAVNSGSTLPPSVRIQIV